MPIFHLQYTALSRAKGRSAVQAAAYRAAAVLHDQRRGQAFDFSGKGDVVASRILLPDGLDRIPGREELWNAVERRETRPDALVAYELLVALAPELDVPTNLALAERFARHAFLGRNLIVDLNLHAQGETRFNIHAHLLVTTRRCLGADADGGLRFGLKCRDTNGPAYIRGLRAEWADALNNAVAEAGLGVRVDHRSFRDRGLALSPTRHVALSKARSLRSDGYVPSDPDRAEANGDRIAARPLAALEVFADEQSVFTRPELAKFLKRFSAPGSKRAFTLSAVLSSPEIVRLGTGPDGALRFTSRFVLERQAALEAEGRACASGMRRSARLLVLRASTDDLEAALGTALGGRRVDVLSSAAPDDAAELGRRLGASSASLGALPLRLARPRGSEPRVLLVSDADRPYAGALLRLLTLPGVPDDVLVLHVDPGRAVAGPAGAAFRGLQECTGALVFEERRLWSEPASREPSEIPAQSLARHVGLRPLPEAPGSFEAVQVTRRRDHAVLAAQRLPRAVLAYLDLIEALAEQRPGGRPDPEGDRRLARARLSLEAVFPDPQRLQRLPRSLADVEALGPEARRATERLLGSPPGPGLEL